MSGNNRIWLRIGVVCALLLLSVLGAQAQIVVKLQSITPAASGYTFTYDLSLTNNATLASGDYVTIYDFYGLVPDSHTQPDNWAFSSAMTGKTPHHIRPTDNPNVPNLTWTYTGPNTGPGPLDLGLFSVNTRFGHVRVADFVSQARLYAPGALEDGRRIYLFSFTEDALSSVTDTHWLALLLPGLLPLGTGIRKIRHLQHKLQNA